MDQGNSSDLTDANIARRTRSHLSYEGFVPNDNLDFPDVDKDLYQNPGSEIDPVYKSFLVNCFSDEAGTDNTNNCDDDPEYVFNDDVFSHGWSYDINEMNALPQDDENPTQQIVDPDAGTSIESHKDLNKLECQPCGSGIRSPAKLPRRRIDMFNDSEFIRILNQQLRQHVQLLAQAFLLTKNTTNMKNEAAEAESHLNSYMDIFENKSKPSNLVPAIDLVNDIQIPRDIKSSIRLSWRPLPIPEVVKTLINKNPNIFLYKSLLPQVAFSFLPDKLIPKKPKINFTLNEDKLLAYALNEFKGESSQYAYIASLLMTAKTKTQISDHIKNIKRSPGNENNPIKLYFSCGELPKIDLDSDSEMNFQSIEREEVAPADVKIEEPRAIETEAIEEADKETAIFQPRQLITAMAESGDFHQDCDDVMNMDLDDLMAASTTISKSTMLCGNTNSENAKSVKNLKLKKSMLNLMSHNFLLSRHMGDLIIYDFLQAAQQKLNERSYLHLLQLLTDLMRREVKKSDDQSVVKIYQEISRFLRRVDAPPELQEKIILFLDLDQATKCGCAISYLHWMRFFEFMQHVELYHEGDEAFEKKLARLVDALQKDDPHKIKLATAGLVSKHPFLKREFESLSLDEKPHPSLFISQEDFDDITDVIASSDTRSDQQADDVYNYEHFNSKVTGEEAAYASQACPCKCHKDLTVNGILSQHCTQCNLKFMKGRMYLVTKIKPILAEWSYTGRTESLTAPSSALTSPQKAANGTIEWTFEEDREILEFCRLKAEQNEETIAFDATTFEELVAKGNPESGSACKKSAREIADRFNKLMELYHRDENAGS